MGGVDRIDDRTFSVNFTGDGADKLRDKVNEKLKEFMGDYTDDALVEYVIVLLKNGRHKEEAKNELNVFLGDDSDTFVSWLWDHLATNIGLYVHSEEPCVDEVVKEKPLSPEKLERNNSSRKLDSESDAGKPKRESKTRNNREWKGLVRDASDPPPLRSSEIENIRIDERSQTRVRGARRSPSPRRADRKKRNRNNGERWESKRETAQVNNGATRRLLQFAVRDAVSMPRPLSNTTSEPSLKRLRSVVSTPHGDSALVEPPRRIKSVARVPHAMATVIKAVAEAAENTARVKSSGSVFDRLGRGMSLSRPFDHDEITMEDSQYGDVNQVHRRKQPVFLQRRGHGGQHVGDTTTIDNETEFISDYDSENEGYDNMDVVHRRGTEVSHTGIYGENNGDSSMMMDCSLDDKAGDDMTRPRRNEGLDQPAVAPNTSRKIVNISVNVNTWKPPHYQEQRVGAEKSGHVGQKSGIRLLRDNKNHVTVNGNTKPAVNPERGPEKAGLPTTGLAGHPLEDVNSRTLFVNNVHFGATKDSLSRHFNKFGEVLKVIIITDVATGQPSGSASVEFMRAEAADNALSLNGTSFMSRLLKVGRRSAAQQESVAPPMTWPRATRGVAPFSTPRFPRASFGRGVLRGRGLLSKGGSRSFQWKRDSQPSPGESVPSLTARSLTYVRNDPKLLPNSGTA